MLKNTPQRPSKTLMPPTNLIVLTDNEPHDHSHESNEDKKDEDNIPKIVEMKPVIASSKAVVKVEKDWWVRDQEKRDKRIAREKARQVKYKELLDANKKIIELEEKALA